MPAKKRPRTKTYARYPTSSIVLYNGVTVAHFVLGGLGVMLGYRPGWVGYLLGSIYLAFAFGQMYVLMPLKVCPSCVYYTIRDSVCASGLNLVSRRIASRGKPSDFAKRAKGLLCHNNLYMAALFAPIILMIPGLLLQFSFWLLALFLATAGLLLFRFLVIFRKVACPHCQARSTCPNAIAMGL